MKRWPDFLQTEFEPLSKNRETARTLPDLGCTLLENQTILSTTLFLSFRLTTILVDTGTNSGFYYRSGPSFQVTLLQLIP